MQHDKSQTRGEDHCGEGEEETAVSLDLDAENPKSAGPNAWAITDPAGFAIQVCATKRVVPAVAPDCCPTPIIMLMYRRIIEGLARPWHFLVGWKDAAGANAALFSQNREGDNVGLATVFTLALAASVLASGQPGQEVQSTPPVPAGDRDLIPLAEFSPAFLGMFRKVMAIEDEIRRFADEYEVDFDLARAVVIQESGGNADLSSGPGADGYFQLMPATFRSLKVKTNIEAGVKYLAQMIRQFGREDYAVAAYNGGPKRVVRGRPPLETLQYVLSVESYRMVLRMHEPSIRRHASALRLEPVRMGDDWWSISRRLGVPVVQLRLYNPFLSTRPLHVDQLMAYPTSPRTDLFSQEGDHLLYRSRYGDNYLLLAFVFDVDREAMREENRLWRLGSIPPGLPLRIPLAWAGKHSEHEVQAGESLQDIATRYGSNVWRLIRDNGLWNEQLTVGAVLKVRPEPEMPATPKPEFVTYRVSSGDTLGAIARRYRTTVRAIQNANGLGSRTSIRVGQRLRIPVRDE